MRKDGQTRGQASPYLQYYQSAMRAGFNNTKLSSMHGEGNLCFTLMTVFWAAAPCSLVEVYQRFRGPCCLHHQGNHRPDDGDSKDL
jgi:hypothetical protein